MVFWSFLAGVVTFYCSIGPDTLLPNMFFNIRPRSNVSLGRSSGWGGVV